MNNADNLRVMLDTITAWTKSIQDSLNRGVSQPAEQASEDVASLKAELEKLGKQQESIKSLRAMRGELGDTNRALADARERVGTLSRSLQSSGQPSQRLVAALANASGAVGELEAKQRSQTRAVGALSSELGEAGLNTRNLAAQQRALKRNIEATTSSLEQATREETRRERRSKRAAEIKDGGEKLQGAGKAILDNVRVVMGEQKSFDDVRLQMQVSGAAPQTIEAAERYARTKSMPGVSRDENFALISDALQKTDNFALATQIAEARGKEHFANASMNDEAEAKIRDAKFASLLDLAQGRDGLKDEKTATPEIDAIHRLIAMNKGDVDADQYAKFAKAGGAAVKGLGSNALYIQSKSVIDELGGKDAGKGFAAVIDSLADGHKLSPKNISNLIDEGLVDPRKINRDPSGAATSFQQDALTEAKTLRAAPADWLAARVKRWNDMGIKDDAQIVARIDSLFTNPAAATYMKSLYSHLADIQADTTRAQKAAGLDTTVAAASKTTRGNEAILHAQVGTFKQQAGESVQPVHDAGIGLAQAGMRSVIDTVNAHPGAAKVVGSTVAVVGGLALSVGGLITKGYGLLSAARAIASMVLGGRVAAGAAGAVGVTAARGAAAATPAARALAQAAPTVARGVVLAGPAARAATAAVSTLPAAATAAKTAAPLGARLLGMLGSVASTVVSKATAALGVVRTASAAGGVLGTALKIGGFAAKLWPPVRLISTLYSVFELGMGVYRAFNQGKPGSGAKAAGASGPDAPTLVDHTRIAAASKGDPSKLPSMMVGALTAGQLFVTSSLASAALPSPLAPVAMPARSTTPFDLRAPLNASRPATPAVVAVPTAPTVINVYAPPGVDAQAVAQLVRNELDKRAREQQQRATAALTD
ncbi:hypothetical protein [Burkholderia gladioli]|uniref:hypothetical protein n=1 Tax=Burkholderia gladioli TaxID=28095 RepID=UPI0016405994|nr:hypothetical protein [Burkholderia gladioli]